MATSRGCLGFLFHHTIMTVERICPNVLVYKVRGHCQILFNPFEDSMNFI